MIYGSHLAETMPTTGQTWLTAQVKVISVLAGKYELELQFTQWSVVTSDFRYPFMHFEQKLQCNLFGLRFKSSVLITGLS